MMASRPRRAAKGFTPEDDAAIAAWLPLGWSAGRIARSIGRNPSTVHARALALGLSWRAAPLRPKQAAARRRVRPCLTCGHSFRSEGPGNRMCVDCRLIASDMSPFEP